MTNTQNSTTEHLFNLLKVVRQTTSIEKIHTHTENAITIPGQQCQRNYAFLDIQNLYRGVKARGWKINWHSFRQYLLKEYNAVKAIVFIGYIKGNEWLYALLENAGFELEFKETRVLKNGQLDNGNCDTDLVSYAMDTKNEYTKAIIVADDSDYISAIQRLNRQNKLKAIISSHLLANTSQQIIRNVSSNILISIHSLRSQISLTSKK